MFTRVRERGQETEIVEGVSMEMEMEMEDRDEHVYTLLAANTCLHLTGV
jgi:hypothetical protein